MENLYTINSDEVCGNLGFKIPNSVVRALQDGNILLSTTITNGGITCWVQFMEPVSMMHVTYDVETAGEILSAATKSTVRPSPPSLVPGKGKQVAFENSVRKDPTSVKEIEILKTQLAKLSSSSSSDTRKVKMTFEQARARVLSKNLGQRRKNGILTSYPVDSLVKEDFKRVDIMDFAARVYTIAERLGYAKIMARITTGGLSIPGANTLVDWWSASTPHHKVRVLSSMKKLVGSYDPIRISEIECPFQDADSHETSDEESASDW